MKRTLVLLLLAVSLGSCQFLGLGFWKGLRFYFVHDFYENGRMREMAQAVLMGDVQKLDRMNKQEYAINTRGKFGASLLLFAAMAGQFESYVYLLDHGANPGDKFDFGPSVPYLALVSSDLRFIKELDNRGYPFNTERHGDRISLFKHAIYSDISIEKFMIVFNNVKQVYTGAHLDEFIETAIITANFEKAMIMMNEGINALENLGSRPIIKKEIEDRASNKESQFKEYYRRWRAMADVFQAKTGIIIHDEAE